MGCAKLPLAWVTSLAWVKLPGTAPASSGGGPTGGEALVLAAGASDGSISLWGASLERLAGLPPRPGGGPAGAAAEAAEGLRQYGALERWGTLCAPDLRGVTCLAVSLVPQGGGGSSGSDSDSSGGGAEAWQLLVAAGKTAGALAVWLSAPLAPPPPPGKQARKRGSQAAPGDAAAGHYGGALRASCQAAPAVVLPALHGLHTISGLSWAAAPVGPPAGPGNGAAPAGALPLLCSASQDGALKCWQLLPGEGGLALRELPAPQPCTRRGKKEAGVEVFGLAASPGGLFVASLARRFPPGYECHK